MVAYGIQIALMPEVNTPTYFSSGAPCILTYFLIRLFLVFHMSLRLLQALCDMILLFSTGCVQQIIEN